MSKWLVSLITVALLFACNKEVTENVVVPNDVDYCPLTKGAFKVYAVDSVVYRDLEKDTVIYNYRLKEVLLDTFTDNTRRLAFRVMRYKQTPDKAGDFTKQPWVFYEATTIKGSSTEILAIENNSTYLRLLFPLTANKQWNGNAYNTQGIQNYTVNYVDQERKVLDKSLPTVKIIEQLQRTKLSLQERTRIYARGIGLIQTVMWDISTDQIDPLNEVEKHIKRGNVVTTELIETGNE